MSAINSFEDNKIVQVQKRYTDNNPIPKAEVVSRNIIENAFKTLASSRILRAIALPTIPALLLLLSNPIGLIAISLAVSISIATLLTYLAAQIIYDNGTEKIFSEISAVKNLFKIKSKENSPITPIFKFGEYHLYFGKKNDNPGTYIDLSDQEEIDSVDLHLIYIKNKLNQVVDLLYSKLSKGNVYINHQGNEIYAKALVSAYLQKYMPTSPEHAKKLAETVLDSHKTKL